jgi:cytochrome c oxidase subunit 3
VNIFAAWIGVAAGILVWWMAVRRLSTKPWEVSTPGAGESGEMFNAESARVGLWVFLAVASALFGLFIAAYFIRMTPHDNNGAVVLQDWRPVIEPRILWFNTALLVAGSIAMQVARSAVGRGRIDTARVGLWTGGGFALAFLVGQWVAWQQLRAAGYYAASNPANAFFYLLTAVHALHVIGGLVVWGRATTRLRHGSAAIGRTRITVELCSIYWHFLLAVWLVLFWLLLAT